MARPSSARAFRQTCSLPATAGGCTRRSAPTVRRDHPFEELALRFAGMTPHQFILRARLAQAALRLRQSREPVITVALETGFNDLSTFNHRFRRLMGATPRTYRTRFQGRR